jgi:hypothetical protein
MPYPEFSVAGKKIYTLQGSDDSSCDLLEIIAFIRKFTTCPSLVNIGKISNKIYHNNSYSFHCLRNTPVTQASLAFISMILINNSNDFRGSPIDLISLEKAIRMYHNLHDPINIDNKAQDFLIRQDLGQFIYNTHMKYSLPRMYHLLIDTWHTTKESMTLDIDQKFISISKLSIKELFPLAIFFASQLSNGYFIKHFNRTWTSKRLFSEQNQSLFISFLSTTYSKFRTVLKKTPPSPGYEKSSLNPLIRYPVIIPNKTPKHIDPCPFIVPIVPLLFNRVTNGIYHDLSDAYKDDDGKNEFRRAFGYVFQNYIGALLHNCTSSYKIIREFKYSRKNLDTPDWMLLNSDALIIIEVKQSSIFLDSKTYGDKDHLHRDLKKTIAKAAGQLFQFERDIRSRKYSVLEELNVSNIESVVVFYDGITFTNSIIKNMVMESITLFPSHRDQNFHFHCMPISDFELFVGTYGDNLFEILHQKRTDFENDRMDFDDYLYQLSDKKLHNAYLDNKRNQLFKDIIKDANHTQPGEITHL